MPIDPLDYAGPWARFRVADARKCLAALRELNRGDLPLTLGLAGGPTLAASLWAVDDAQGCLTFKLDPTAAQVLAVAALPQAWAAAYLGDVKLQFALTDLRLSETPGLAGRAAGTTLTLQTRLPRDLYCLPRRVPCVCAAVARRCRCCACPTRWRPTHRCACARWTSAPPAARCEGTGPGVVAGAGHDLQARRG